MDLLKTAPQAYSEGNGRWEFPEDMGTSGYVGFIYVLYDTVMHRAYLGKKSYMATLKGKKIPSDWRNYKSSSEYVKTMLAGRPSNEFQWICIEQYKTKGTLSWAETYSLCYAQAPTTSWWYNKRVEGISWKVSEQISKRHMDRLDKIITLLKDKNA